MPRLLSNALNRGVKPLLQFKPESRAVRRRYFVTQYRCVPVRMKISPSANAGVPSV